MLQLDNSEMFSDVGATLNEDLYQLPEWITSEEDFYKSRCKNFPWGADANDIHPYRVKNPNSSLADYLRVSILANGEPLVDTHEGLPGLDHGWFELNLHYHWSYPQSEPPTATVDVSLWSRTGVSGNGNIPYSAVVEVMNLIMGFAKHPMYYHRTYDDRVYPFNLTVPSFTNLVNYLSL